MPCLIQPPVLAHCTTAELQALGSRLPPLDTSLLCLSLAALAHADAAVLDHQERHRLQEAANPAWRNQFLRTRWALRGVLAGLTGVPPEQVPLQREDSGRLRLLPVNGTVASLSISHSGDWLMFAINPEGLVIGLDVQSRLQARHLRIARRYFSRLENDWLASLDAERQVVGFQLLWALKESLVKALQCSFTMVCRRFSLLPTGLADHHPRMADWQDHSGRMQAGQLCIEYATMGEGETIRALAWLPGENT